MGEARKHDALRHELLCCKRIRYSLPRQRELSSVADAGERCAFVRRRRCICERFGVGLSAYCAFTGSHATWDQRAGLPGCGSAQNTSARAARSTAVSFRAVSLSGTRRLNRPTSSLISLLSFSGTTRGQIALLGLRLQYTDCKVDEGPL